MWQGERTYTASQVNVLRAMFARHLRVAHRFVVITDDEGDFAPGVEVLPVPEEARALAAIKSPEGKSMPSCYRRLWLFSKAAECLGDRVLLTDIDCVLTGDVTHLLEPKASFVGWRPLMSWGNSNRVAGGLYLLKTGTHTDVWDDFSAAGVAEAARLKYRGSDQAWLSYKLGKTAALWPERSGVYALSDLRDEKLPADACMVQFAGNVKPWDAGGMPWVREHYKGEEAVSFNPSDFRSIVARHKGKRICVMGGSPALAEHMQSVEADVYVSANDHGARIRPVDYMVAMDHVHGVNRMRMDQYLHTVSDAPIISGEPFADYQLPWWPSHPRRILSGMAGVYVAWALGAKLVIVAGMDAYDGKESAIRDAKAVANDVRCEVRVVGGGPLTEVWPAYDPAEKFGRFVPHSSLDGLRGMDGLIRVRVMKPTMIRGMAVAKGDQLSVMRHEVAGLLRHRMLVEL